ncbi:hypothetical protein [Legionella taurinensis]|uniref:hypothetical protein n=1 Tax=Legionella taurinensis TaxID=70611 RepID=UPI00299DA567|nr:hypothetical protein [Legionella taurinensis]MDX1837304.1 hypothetical protein [Legionella taurinensis]
MKDFIHMALNNAGELLSKATSDNDRRNLDTVIAILKLIKHEKHYEKDNLELSQEIFDKLISGSVNTENVLEALEILHINGSNGKNGKPKQQCMDGKKRAGIPISTNMLELLIEHSNAAETLVSGIQLLDAVKFSRAMKESILDVIRRYPNDISSIVHGASLLADDDDVVMAYLSRLNQQNVKNAVAIANKLSDLEMDDQLTIDTLNELFAESSKDFSPKSEEPSEELILNKGISVFSKKINPQTGLSDTLLNNSFFKGIRSDSHSASTLINPNESEMYSLD